MKLITLFLILGLMQASASEYSQFSKVEFTQKNISIYQAQVVSISGKVTDEKGQPLPGVSVTKKGTSTGVITNSSGNYTIKLSDKDATLVFSFVGYISQEVVVGNQTTIDIKLVEKINALNEIVIVGYGKTKKATLTGAVSSVTGSEIVATRNENVVNSLAGRVAGLRVVQNTAEPGKFNTTFDIRGYAANGGGGSGSSPLIIIDGVPSSSNIFARLDANDIENVSILKDASAAIYGVQAANGVILVTTRKGKSGIAQINYSFTSGMQMASKYPTLAGAVDWMTLINESSMHNINNPTITYPQAIIDTYTNGTLKSTDWNATVLNKSAPQWQHNLTASGGSENVNYFLSFGYEKQDGLFKSNSLNFNI